MLRNVAFSFDNNFNELNAINKKFQLVSQNLADFKMLPFYNRLTDCQKFWGFSVSREQKIVFLQFGAISGRAVCR